MASGVLLNKYTVCAFPTSLGMLSLELMLARKATPWAVILPDLLSSWLMNRLITVPPISREI